MLGLIEEMDRRVAGIKEGLQSSPAERTEAELNEEARLVGRYILNGGFLRDWKEDHWDACLDTFDPPTTFDALLILAENPL